MWKSFCVLLCLGVCCSAGPLAYQKKNMPIKAREVTAEASPTMTEEAPSPAAETAAPAAPLMGTLTLPSNATSIRADITDNFSCANKSYGYYADVENDCQIFHVCLPVTYADGKENTFRWSFICPEETIFSQESFTCMRREDMTIECEDSSRYYELNGNFGGPIEEDSNKQPMESTAEMTEPQMQSAPAESKPIMQKPKPMENEVTMETAASEPALEPAKPVKVQKPKPKPNRRKPAVTYNRPQTHVQAKPQRKVTPAPPMMTQEVEESLAVAATQTVAEAEPKPMKPTRFGPRPGIANNKEKEQIIAVKEKPQIVKVAVMPTRNELFSSNRKRPAVFNKNTPAIPAKPLDVVTESVVQAELSEPEPTLKLETMFTAEEKPSEDSTAQASEPAGIIALPEETVETVKLEELKPEKLELPVVLEPIEAVEEIPAVIVEKVEEEIKQPEELKIQETQSQDKEEILKDSKPEEPSIVEPSLSAEETASNLEALEAEKPADAPETMPATPEMEQHSPLVEEILDNSSSNSGSIESQKEQESIGGFKQVDPAMAAEAEQLITDFLNTLKKNEANSKIDMILPNMEMAETIEEKEKPEETQQLLKQTDEKPTEDEAVSIEEAKLPEPEITDKDASIEEQILETDSVKKPPQTEEILQDSPITNIFRLNQMPADLFQIPVQVIETPQPEKGESKPQPEAVKTEDEAPQESIATAAFMPPMSIDDIVEMVKERLDQSPKNEQLAPMELVLTPGAAAPMALKQAITEVEAEIEREPAPVIEHQQEEEPQKSQPEEPQEEVILPIYKRVSAAEPAMTKVQTIPVTATKIDSEPEVSQDALVTPVQKMDARKRRFLFRADVSR